MGHVAFAKKKKSGRAVEPAVQKLRQGCRGCTRMSFVPDGQRTGWVHSRRLPRKFPAVVVVLAVLYFSKAAWGVIQPSDSSSYQYLSEPAKEFVDQLVGDDDGQLDDAAAYDSLEQSKRTTFEAIMHALDGQGLLDIVTRVTAIWGEEPNSNEGRDQFRISVALVEGVKDRLASVGYVINGRGHVKKANGDLKDEEYSDTARQPGGFPSLQVSWLVSKPTVGEVDIDYVPYGLMSFITFEFLTRRGHFSPENSDVRAEVGNTRNYDTHVRGYGYLEEWWGTR